MGGMSRHGALTAIALLALTFLLSGVSGGGEEAVNPRKASFAGSFYPSDRKTLEKTITAYYGAAESGEKISAHIFGIIVPHAGYQYSGLVAAFGYNQIKGNRYKTVILLGSSHRLRFKGVSIDTGGSWETPLGRVRINHEASRALVAKCPSIKPYPSAFHQEHSLEVQLPFLQSALKEFTIVPLITGSMDEEDYRGLSSALTSLLKANPREILVVVSSDLSHYHSYPRAGEMDALALSEIESLNAEKLKDCAMRGKCELCGLEAVLSFISVARDMNAKARLLRYVNSGDVTGDRDRVVGYGSVAFSYRDDKELLHKRQQALLLDIARRAIDASLSGKGLPGTDRGDSLLWEKRGVFVTLKRKGALRGCVGYIRPVQPLFEAVAEMAVAASSRDTRFRPLSRAELKDIRIEISVLSPLKPLVNPREIEVGTHGLYIVRGNSSGLLLPQVAAEYKWNREEFLENTCLKAGLPPQTWKEKGTAIYTFSAQIFAE
jgi:MEMO1 family protein